MTNTTMVAPRTCRIISAAAWLAVSAGVPASRGGPINSDVAFTPHKGGSILRLQYSFSETDGNGDVQGMHSSRLTGTYMYGLTSDFALFLTIPYANRQVDLVDPELGRLEEAHDGVADLTFLAKYRFWQNDPRPLETQRWAVLGGLNIRSGDSHFTSDSYDPLLGTVFTWQRDRILLDADLIYQFNTGRGPHGHDALRYDVAFSYRLFPAAFEPAIEYEWDAVVELNGRYVTNGSHELFLSPGLQLITPQWVLESSIQLPVIQDLAGDQPETEYRLVTGVRFQW